MLDTDTHPEADWVRRMLFVARTFHLDWCVRGIEFLFEAVVRAGQ